MENEILQQILTELRELKADVKELKRDVSEIKEQQKIDTDSIDLILANSKDIMSELHIIDSITKDNTYGIAKLRATK